MEKFMRGIKPRGRSDQEMAFTPYETGGLTDGSPLQIDKTRTRAEGFSNRGKEEKR